jgi:hypothetical protein
LESNDFVQKSRSSSCERCKFMKDNFIDSLTFRKVMVVVVVVGSWWQRWRCCVACVRACQARLIKRKGCSIECASSAQHHLGVTSLSVFCTRRNSERNSSVRNSSVRNSRRGQQQDSTAAYATVCHYRSVVDSRAPPQHAQQHVDHHRSLPNPMLPVPCSLFLRAFESAHAAFMCESSSASSSFCKS